MKIASMLLFILACASVAQGYQDRAEKLNSIETRKAFSIEQEKQEPVLTEQVRSPASDEAKDELNSELRGIPHAENEPWSVHWREKTRFPY